MKLSTVLLSLIFLISAFRHDFHTSLAEIGYNASEQTLEVSLRVFTDDLEAALSKENGGKSIKIDPTQGTDSYIQNYLHKHFTVIDGTNRSRPVHFLGKEIAVDVTWLYFEITGVESLNAKKLQNSVFTELFSDQVNMVNVKLPSGNRSYLFKADEPVQVLSR